MTLLQYGKLKSKLIACGYYGIISLVEKLRWWLSLKGGDAYESKHQNLQRGDACLSAYETMQVILGLGMLNIALISLVDKKQKKKKKK